MSNIRDFPQKNASYDRASDWIAKLDKGLSPREENKLRVWLASSEENYTVFMEMAKLWDKMDVLSRLADVCPDAAKKSFNLRRYTWPVAASVFLAIALITLSVIDTPVRETVTQSTALAFTNVFETKIGEQSAFTLSDDTRVVLNTNSHVSVVYTKYNRLLYLESGEMHVNVAHDALRPLSVVIGERVIQAVGTEFNIEITNNQSIELVVTDGVVIVGVLEGLVDKRNPHRESLLSTSSSTIVAAGQEIVIDPENNMLAAMDAETINVEEIAVKLSWREGNLIFRGESLEEAVSEVGRYTAVQFVFLDEESKKVRVAGLFKAGDVDGLLNALRKNFNISSEWVGDDKILLSGQ